MSDTALDSPLYPDVSCSQCGRSFGPGDHGFSYCYQHKGYARDIHQIREALINEAGRLSSIADDITPAWTTLEEIEVEILRGIRNLFAVRRLVLAVGVRK